MLGNGAWVGAAYTSRKQMTVPRVNKKNLADWRMMIT